MGVNDLYAQVDPPASPFLTPDHWSYRTLRRLDHAGLLPRGSDVARQSIPQEEIAALLAHADSMHGTSYLRQFRREFSAARIDTLTSIAQSLVTGFSWTKDLVAPGIGYDLPNWDGARRLDDDRDYLYGLRFGVAYAPHVAGGADLVADDAEYQIDVTAGHFGLWGGRRRIGFGVGDGGGLVLNAHPLIGGGVFLPKPLRIPVLGPLRFEMHLSQIDNVLNREGQQFETEPWFWTARASIEPVQGVRFGINRAMMFGGDGNVPLTFSRVAKSLIGLYGEDDDLSFANQIVSFDLRVRLRNFPVIAYIDWGTDDGAGAMHDVPGILGGLEYVHVARTFDLAVGAEHTHFAGSCCGNSIWYRNAWFRGSWADGEAALGHPLGGHGREWRVFANGSTNGGAFNASLAGFARDRRAENILAPAWQGKSNGLQGAIDVALNWRIRFEADGEIEWGDADWTASRLSVALRGRL